MPSVSYDFVPGQDVYVIEDGTIKSGRVVEVDISVTNVDTTVTYQVSVSGTTSSYSEDDVYENCRAMSGYQNVVFTNSLSVSQVAIPVGSSLVGETIVASVVIDGGISIPLSLLVAGGETFQNILDNLNLSINSEAEAALDDNNIKITSRSTGVSSTVEITDGGTGSPTPTPYFESLNTYEGLAASVAGQGDGALEALGAQVC